MNSLTSKEISEKIVDIQNKWSDNVINIGKAYLEKKDYIELTNSFLDNLYNFSTGKVLFKPTKASKLQFRSHRKEFISYFIGHKKVSDEDAGFALEPWKNIEFENYKFININNLLISMGNYFFTNYKNEKIKVEFSFGYVCDQKNDLKIVFHHSSLPYKT